MSVTEARKSPSSCKRSKYERKRSLGELSVEELLPDDMGYDADIETIKPDKCEEVESESEDAATPNRGWRSIDEELAARMRQLGREQMHRFESSTERGRKRRSVEMGDESAMFSIPRSPQLDIQEVVDNVDAPSPAKRRRKKSNRRNPAQHILRGYNEGWTDSSERTENHGRLLQDASTSPTHSDYATTKRNEDDDMMDVA